MNAANIHYKNIVNEYPHIIITAEFKDNRVSFTVHNYLGVFRQIEFHTHGQSKMMIQVFVPGSKLVILRIPLMEGEETDFPVSSGTGFSVRIALILQIVCAIVNFKAGAIVIRIVLIAVIDVIIPDLFEKAVSIGIRSLIIAIARSKQVIEAFSPIELRIAV